MHFLPLQPFSGSIGCNLLCSGNFFLSVLRFFIDVGKQRCYFAIINNKLTYLFMGDEYYKLVVKYPHQFKKDLDEHIDLMNKYKLKDIIYSTQSQWVREAIKTKIELDRKLLNEELCGGFPGKGWQKDNNLK